MNGVVDLRFSDRNVSFRLRFRRNITILRGDSGSGKTALCTFVRQSILGAAGIIVENPKKVKFDVFSTIGDTWVQALSLYKNTLIFIDESFPFLNTRKFSEIIKHTDNYYVLVTRDDLGCLPYSVQEIYELKFSGYYSIQRQIVMNNIEYYNDLTEIKPELILTEDSGTGLSFFKNLTACSCISAYGKDKVSNIFTSILEEGTYDNILIVVDGAAFGNQYPLLSDLISRADKHVALFMPESFEWFLLNSVCFKKDNIVTNVLLNFLYLVDYSKYFSLENYFEHELKIACNRLYFSYDKFRELNPTFLTERNKTYLLSLLKNIKFYDSDTEYISSNLTEPTDLFSS